ncbi:sushi: von Willebrand factor type A: EGF and pentraxin domain-containing protein 1-like protein, partial [Dinothrombium tinctorium]
QTCPQLSLPPYGEFPRPCGTAVGAKCHIGCLPGFELIGSCHRICLPNGEWSGEPAQCVNRAVQCPVLSPPANGTIVNQCQNIAGSTCTFLCNSGMNLVGSSTTVCQINGTWTHPPPECRSELCPEIAPPSNGSIVGGKCNLALGSVCEFQCQEGFTLQGDSKLFCSPSGNWSSPPPKCVIRARLICPNLTAPANGAINGSCGQEVGDSCSFICNDGFTLAGEKNLYCLKGGNWSNVPPKCMVMTTTTAATTTTQITTTKATTTTTTTTTTTPSTTTTTAAPKKCRSLRPPLNGAIQGICQPGVEGQQCIFTCRTGYILSGATNLICQANEEWNAPVPRCQINECPSLSAPACGTASGSCSPGIVGRRCRFACGKNCRLVGSATLICTTDGTWSDSAPICQSIICPHITAPVGGILSGNCNPAIPGQSCSLYCRSGYRLRGTSPITCTPNGSWSSTPPTCEAIPPEITTTTTRKPPARCPSLKSPANGNLQGTCQPGMENQQCSVSCLQGYALVGQTNIICLASGSWSAPLPTCQLNVCPSLVSPTCGTASGVCSPGVVGQNCTFSCSNGCKLYGRNTLICQPMGVWSSHTPTCQRNFCPVVKAPPQGVLIGSCAAGSERDVCTLRCQSGYKIVGTAQITCLSSGMWSANLGRCQSKLVSMNKFCCLQSNKNCRHYSE